jgi:RNA polymerase sigma-70 factor (ECF subfamily)
VATSFPGSNGERLDASHRLLARARAGDTRALSTLFRRQGAALRKWARGRLPRWARNFAETADLVQEALFQTFRRIDRFEDRGKGALQAYLRQAVTNRIRDEMRRVGRQLTGDSVPPDTLLQSGEPSPFESALDAERERKYKLALATLTEDERLLVVARMELGYNYEQLALISNRSTADAARVAVRRAVLKVAERMSDR